MAKKKIGPYPYQEECLQKIEEVRQNGVKRALVVMASGLGKTYTSAFAVERFFADRTFGRVLVLCHSEEILTQTKKKFKKYFGEEYNYGMFTNSRKTRVRTNFLFATFQTMKGHRTEFAKDEFDYVVVDEAHHSYARTYFPTIKYFEPQFLLGLTATPDRLDGQKITEIYGEPIYELDFVEANCRDLLTKCDYRLMLDDMSQEKLDEYVQSNEKLTIGQLNRTIFVPKRDEEIVRLIRECMDGLEDPKTMIFCRTIKHARKIARLVGDEAALVYHGQGDVANEMALEAFREGRLRMIISVQMLNEGIDVPDANHVVFLRSTVSPAVFYQQLGRGTRLSPGKTTVIVQDFVANCERVQEIIRLQNEIDDFRTRPPKDDDDYGTSDGDKSENFTLNIATPEFKTKMVDIVELLERAANGRVWTKEDAIEALRRLAKKLGKEGLMVKDIRDAAENVDNEDRDGYPGRETLKRLFGSVQQAIIAAGLEYERGYTGTERGTFETEEELFVASRAYAIELGHPNYLSLKDIDDNLDFPCWETLRKKYKTLKNFLRLAGFKDIKRAGRRLAQFDSKVAIRRAIQRKTAELGGKIPTRRQLEADQEMPSIAQIRKFYPSYNDALLDACGKVNANRKSATQYPDEMMEKEAKNMFEESGHTPTMAEWNANPRTCSASVLEKRHGSYNKAMIAYGLCPNKKGTTLNHPRVISGVLDGEDLTPETRVKLEKIIKTERRRLKGGDFGPKNSLPIISFFFQHGWSMDRLNSYIGVEKNIRQVLLPHEAFDPEMTLVMQNYIRKVRRRLKWEDFTKVKDEEMPSISYLRKCTTSIDVINSIVEADIVLAEFAGD